MKKPDYILIDTEFVREKTYFSKLCLIQVAGPGIDPHYIDPLDEKTDLQPLFDMLFDPEIIKVLHSGYQDLEIFYHLCGKVPAPIFDTQVAASVLGYGDQVSYANLVRDVCGVEISKSHQFTDWSIRPLSQAQIDYALGDVIYLDDVYHKMVAELDKRGRRDWVGDDLAALQDPSTFAVDPMRAWEKIKMRSDKPKHLGALQLLAAWREERAMVKDLPKGFILKDDALMEIAMTAPKNAKDLARVRGFPESQVDRGMGKAFLDIVHKIQNTDPKDLPKREKKKPLPASKSGILEILRLFLKIIAAEHDLTPKRIADSDDLETIAMYGEKADVPAMRGWRYKIFGSKCVELMDGKAGLAVKNGKVEISPVK
jgi:ribonuclease D